MSLALLEGYSSAEGAEEDQFCYQNSSDDESNEETGSRSSMFPLSELTSGSALPSVSDAFTEITGPPEFLNNYVEEPFRAKDAEQRQGRHRSWRTRKEKKDLPAGAVVEAKALLVGIRERVRSDIEGNGLPTSSVQTQKGPPPEATQGVSKSVATATNPSAEDAAELLRMCLQCGIPKTFSSARGMICPVCTDRPPTDPNADSQKKKGSTIKDKEKIKRMKGQSSHATWKSETAMQLRQQFD